jgi:heterodisulfide reductase subunit D
MTGHTFADALAQRAEGVVQDCTACGKCFEVCPMTGPAGLAEVASGAVTTAVRDLVAGGEGSPAAARWASVCSGSGSCIPVCPEGVNPRFMLTLARLATAKIKPQEDRRKAGAVGFRGMSKAVRVLSRIQLAPEDLARFDAPDSVDSAAPVDIVFYTGCNLRRTPHIGLLCFQILDRLGVRWRVEGGPQACCGIQQTRSGDVELAGSVAYRTTGRFAAARPKTVLAWCPTCHVQIGENVLAGRRLQEPATFSFGMQPFIVWLAEHLDDVRPMLTRPVEKRIALHEHPGVAGVTEAAIRLLRAIPGLELVDLEQPSVGYMCNTLQPLPDFKRDLHQRLLEAAAEAKVDALAGVYHVCHRELCSHERDWPFEVINVMELIGASMGLAAEDDFKRLKKMQDLDAVLADVEDLAKAYGLHPQDVREVVAKELLGEQPLALRGS